MSFYNDYFTFPFRANFLNQSFPSSAHIPVFIFVSLVFVNIVENKKKAIMNGWDGLKGDRK